MTFPRATIAQSTRLHQRRPARRYTKRAYPREGTVPTMYRSRRGDHSANGNPPLQLMHAWQPTLRWIPPEPTGLYIVHSGTLRMCGVPWTPRDDVHHTSSNQTRSCKGLVLVASLIDTRLASISQACPIMDPWEHYAKHTRI